MSNSDGAYDPIIASVFAAASPTGGSTEAAFVPVVLGVNKVTKPPKARQSPDLKLPWRNHNYSFFEVLERGVRFLVAVVVEHEDPVKEAIPRIAQEIASSNVFIEDAERRVSTCFICEKDTQFAFWNDEPVVVLYEHKNFNDPAGTAHEMAHAIYDAQGRSARGKGQGAARAAAFQLRIGDIFVRLGKTTKTTVNDRQMAVGHAMVDPSQWRPNGPFEHPFRDPDEFFASALEAYQFGRTGLQSAIQQATMLDAGVEQPANELMELLRQFVEREAISISTLTPERRKAAEEALRLAIAPAVVSHSSSGDGLADTSLRLGALLDPSRREDL